MDLKPSCTTDSPDGPFLKKDYISHPKSTESESSGVVSKYLTKCSSNFLEKDKQNISRTTRRGGVVTSLMEIMWMIV